MQINLKGWGSFEANPDNANILIYPNDLMDGLFVDLDKEYCFVPKFLPGYVEVETIALGIGIQQIEVVHYDLTEAPHCWVVNALARCTVAGFEALIA